MREATGFPDIDGVVWIPMSGLYVKSPEALEKLLATLQEMGYTTERSMHNGAPLTSWFAKLTEGLGRVAKCCHCQMHFGCLNIRSKPEHRCPHCGKLVFQRFVKGKEFEFRFQQGEGSDMWTLRLKVFGYDATSNKLTLYAEPLEPRNQLINYAPTTAASILVAHRDEYDSRTIRPSAGARKHIRALKAAGQSATIARLRTANPDWGKTVITIPYRHRLWQRSSAVIEPCEVREYIEYAIVKLYGGVEYADSQQLPVPENQTIYEMWHHGPLGRSPKLHEQILHAGSMVSRCDYYYQDGRRACYDTNLKSMALFVDHFTVLDIAHWKRMITRAPMDGPGLIRAVAAFCHDRPVISDEPNALSGLLTLQKVVSGGTVSEAEVAALERAIEDRGTQQVLIDVVASLRGPNPKS